MTESSSLSYQEVFLEARHLKTHTFTMDQLYKACSSNFSQNKIDEECLQVAIPESRYFKAFERMKSVPVAKLSKDKPTVCIESLRDANGCPKTIKLKAAEDHELYTPKDQVPSTRTGQFTRSTSFDRVVKVQNNPSISSRVLAFNGSQGTGSKLLNERRSSNGALIFRKVNLNGNGDSKISQRETSGVVGGITAQIKISHIEAGTQRRPGYGLSRIDTIRDVRSAILNNPDLSKYMKKRQRKALQNWSNIQSEMNDLNVFKSHLNNASWSPVSPPVLSISKQPIVPITARK